MTYGRPALALRARVTLVALSAFLVFGSTVSATGAPKAPRVLREAREVRTVWTGGFGIPRPTGISYVPARGELLVAGDASVLRLGFDEEPRGTFRLDGPSDLDTLAFDPSRNRLTAIGDGALISVAARDLRLGRPSVSRTTFTGTELLDPRGATFDPATGDWFVLDAGANAVVRMSRSGGPATRTSLAGLGATRFTGIAFNPSDGLVYVANQRLLYGLDGSGMVRETYSLASLGLMDQRAMTFAPSSDPTDEPATLNLFIADAGTSKRMGGVMEVTLAAAATLSAPVVTASLVRIVETSAWDPGSPDPSGVVYLQGRNVLQVTDSEVDETTGAGYHGVNMWQTDLTGNVSYTWTTHPAYSREPTGLGYDAGSDTLFISDDSKRRIFVVNPGPGGQFGDSNDVVTWVDTGAYGSTDTEDPEFHAPSGHLFFVDGAGKEIYRIDPVNGVFGDGNDVMTHFDISGLGATDFEALGSDPNTGNLLVGGRREKMIYEITTGGSLVRTIDASGISGFRFTSGLGTAPASDGSGGTNIYIVDRAVDNGANSNENDGKLIEISYPSSSSNNPPVVTNPGTKNNTEGDSGALVDFQIQASDPDSGDTIASYGASGLPTGLSVDPTTGWITGTTTSAGTYAVTIWATDNHGATGSTSFTWIVSSPSGPPPSISGFAPASGSVGTAVTIDGSNFTGTTDVRFNGTSVGNFTVVSAAQITTTVPSLATTGPISVITPAGPAWSSSDFTVTGGSGGTLTFGPDADTYVLERRATKNYGSRTSLQVDNGPQKHTLFKFTVPDLGGATIASVTLRLYCVNASNKGGDFAELSNDWQENSVTWNSAPAPGAQVGSLGAVATGTWYEVDVSSYVNGDGTFSFSVTSTSNNGADYVSKEGAAGFTPELVVTLA